MSLSVLLFGDLLAVEEDVADDGRGVGVRDKVDRGDGLCHIEVGNLARCYRTVILAQTHGCGTVDGGGIERLGGLQPQLEPDQDISQRPPECEDCRSQSARRAGERGAALWLAQHEPKPASRLTRVASNSAL